MSSLLFIFCSLFEYFWLHIYLNYTVILFTLPIESQRNFDETSEKSFQESASVLMNENTHKFVTAK